jgi:hypothetical protein
VVQRLEKSRFDRAKINATEPLRRLSRRLREHTPVLTNAGYFHSFIALQQNAVPEGHLVTVCDPAHFHGRYDQKATLLPLAHRLGVESPAALPL